ncbi:MAG TPA: autotransporter domain-containing protein [Rhizomicrobium sp.]|jgi:subtilase-type serine protease|nr:autotransporter domain-containing protein [Rhizomicrobium sp.]
MKSRHAARGALVCAGLLYAPATAIAQAVPTPNANQYGPQMIGAPTAWARGYSGAGVTVVVADSGIDPNHTAFAGKIDPRSKSFVLTAPGAAYDPTAINDPDPQSHGTHVAGIVAASAASGVPGIGYNAGIVVLKMIAGCAKGQNCDAPGIPNASAAALDYYAGLANAIIYNASYGPSPPANTTSWPANFLDPDEAASALGALVKGKIVVAATGNDRTISPVASANPNGLALDPFIQPGNANAGVYQDGNNNYNFSNLLNQPGLIVAVTAVGANKLIASYAQLCGVTASWCVAAPGGDDSDNGIYSTLPGNKFGYLQGTSMATPAVSGALAVLQQAYPAYGARDLANVLFATAENVGGQAADNATYGYGLIRLDRATDGPTTLAAGAGVDVATQQTTYWSQPLTTAGGFSKTGAGYLIVAGRTTAAGDVNVAAGAIGVDGTLTLQTTMTVAPGATLAGFGRIVGNTVINGTLDAGQLPNYADLAANNGGAVPAGIPASGSSPGTLTFQGNVTFGAAATMRENIDGALLIPGGPGTFDKIVVTGTGATFAANGTLAPVLRGIVGGNNNYSPAVGTSFVIVTAQNGAAVAGQFATLAQPGAGLAANTRLDVVYTTTMVTLNVTPLNFAAVAAGQNLDPNARALAGALDVVRPDAGARPGTRSATVFDDLYDDSIGEDDGELNALADQGGADVPAAALSAYSGFSDTLAQRQARNLFDTPQGDPSRVAWGYGDGIASDVDTGGAGTPAISDAWTAWAQGFGRWSSIQADIGLPGSHSSDDGMAAGADRRFSPELTAGGAFGYARTTTVGGGETAVSDVYAAALYAAWTPGDFTVDARLATGPSDSTTARMVSVFGTPTLVTGAAHGIGVLGAVEGGWRTRLDDIDLEPYLGMDAQTLHRSGYSETSMVGLSFPAQDFTKTVTKLGARAATRFDVAGFTVAPQIDIAWTHDLEDDTLVTHAAILSAPFDIEAAGPGRDAAVVGIDLSAWQSETFSLFVGYRGEFRARATSQEVHGGLRLQL